MKKSIAVLIFLFSLFCVNNIRAQEATVVPSMDLYDSGMMNMYLGAVRDASNYDLQLAEDLQPIINSAFDKYNRKEYWECISTVNSVFDRVNFYKRQYRIYSQLYYIRGLSYMAVGQEDNGISNLVEAMNAKSDAASKALENYFTQYQDIAYQEYQAGQYSNCLQHVNRALSTKYYSYSIYEIGGAANECLNNFSEAEKYYNLAKKTGSPSVNQFLKALDVHKKQYYHSH